MRSSELGFGSSRWLVDCIDISTALSFFHGTELFQLCKNFIRIGAIPRVHIPHGCRASDNVLHFRMLPDTEDTHTHNAQTAWWDAPNETIAWKPTIQHHGRSPTTTVSTTARILCIRSRVWLLAVCIQHSIKECESATYISPTTQSSHPRDGRRTDGRKEGLSVGRSVKQQPL